MPPPLILRHTRPCRPSWNAHLVRHASSNPQSTLATASDDTFVKPTHSTDWQRTGSGGHDLQTQQNSSEHSTDAIPQRHTRRSLWSAAMDRISTFVSEDTRPSKEEEEPPSPPSTVVHAANSENAASTKTIASRSETPTADQDAVREADAVEANSSFRVRRMALSRTSKYNPDVHAKLEELSRLLKHMKPEQRVGLVRRARLLQQPQPEKKQHPPTQKKSTVLGKMTEGHAAADLAIRSSKLSHHNESAQERRSFRKVPTLSSAEPRTRSAHPVQDSAADVTSVGHEKPAQASDWAPQLDTLQQQLRVLAEQVKMLKKSFDTMAAKPESSRKSSLEVAVSENKANEPRSTRPESKTGQSLIASSLVSVVGAAQSGHQVYCSSTTALADIVKSLDADPFTANLQISERIRARLATIARQAAEDDDHAMRKALLATNLFRRNISQAGKRKALKINSPSRQRYLQGYADRRKLSADKDIPGKSSETSIATGSNVVYKAVRQARVAESERTIKSGGDEIDCLKAISDPGKEEKLSTIKSVSDDSPAERPNDVNGLSQQTSAAMASDADEQSLLDELFPEVNVPVSNEPVEHREQYPKLQPPSSDQLIRPKPVAPPKEPKQQILDSFLKSGENITVLQLQHCSVELTEFDFRRLIPKGKHIDAWNRDGAYHKVIPGRNPISLERLPFYYILFKSADSAYAYQNNVVRLHKLAALHQPTNIFSAVPPPRGFLEDGEDIDVITSSYLLRPTEHAPAIHTLMQPYHPGLRSLFQQGGYAPIVPDVDDKKNRIYKVLMHIEGYEPSMSDLFTIFRRDAAHRGIPLPLRNESIASLHRLRDLVNLKTHVLPVATTNPRAYDTARSTGTKIVYEDPSIALFMKNEDPVEEDNVKEINQIIMNQVYNRWILEFDDEDEARRFAIAWHRRALPDLSKVGRTWKDYEEARMCNTELLW